MSDVLALSVPLGSKYASVNNVGANSHRAGKKSPAYKALFADVKAAAEAEIERTGWEKASCECAVKLVRYVTDRRRRDASNAGKCEADALTAAGVWEDDCLANPWQSVVRYDPQGQHRISIVVVKLHQSVAEGVIKNDSHVAVPKVLRIPQRRVHVSSPREGAGRTKQSVAGPPGAFSVRAPGTDTSRPVEAVTNGDSKSVADRWKPGDPIPDGFAVLAGELVTREFAIDKMRGEA